MFAGEVKRQYNKGYYAKRRDALKAKRMERYYDQKAVVDFLKEEDEEADDLGAGWMKDINLYADHEYEALRRQDMRERMRYVRSCRRMR